MVNFLNELVSGEDDEPPPSERVEELANFSPYHLLGTAYQSLTASYYFARAYNFRSASASNNFEVEVNLSENIPEDYHSWLPDETYAHLPEFGEEETEDEFEQIRRTLEEPQCSFERAIMEYIFEQPSLEGDVLADDRELMDDQQKALIPYFWKQMQRRAEEEDRIIYKFHSSYLTDGRTDTRDRPPSAELRRSF